MPEVVAPAAAAQDVPVCRRAAILGLGLIGGSLALRWRRVGAVASTVGFARSAEHLARARDMGVVDEVATDLTAAVQGADLVVLAAPIQACIGMAPQVAVAATPGCLITDVGSTKAAIAAAMAEALRPWAGEAARPVFVGGHPMAGSERSGVEAADPYLFEHAVWVLCPSDGSPEWATARLRRLVEAAGAHAVLMDPLAHDARVAAISHVPQLVAVALAEAAGRAEAQDPGVLGLAGGGFRDTTRIAASPAGFWLDVLDTNRAAVLANLDVLGAVLADLRRAVADGDRPALAQHFAAAASVRQRVPARQKGLLPCYHDLVLYVPDQPGVLGALCGALGARGVNIQDIEILRLREGEGGMLRLGFATADGREAAAGILEGLGYVVQRR
jgi:prephenate dehydrogenase